MFESILKKGLEGGIILAGKEVIMILLVTLGLGLVLSIVYIFTNRKRGFGSSFPTTLIILPLVVSIVLMLVGNNLASAFALAGVFTLVRFRSEPGDPRDITYIFATVAAGLASGMGFIGYAFIATMTVSIVLLLLHVLRFGETSNRMMKLKVLVPEDLNYEDAFDDIFETYDVQFMLDKVRTAEFGTVYELVYRIKIPKQTSSKSLIDELRTRNGNLMITLIQSEHFSTKGM